MLACSAIESSKEKYTCTKGSKNMSSKVTRESMVVRKGGKAISASERPVEVGKLGAYGAPAYSMTLDGAGAGEKGWSHIWLRFSETTPELESHLREHGWELAKRGAWGYTNNAQGQAFAKTLTSQSGTPAKSSTQAPKTKTKTKTEPAKPVETPATQTPAPTEKAPAGKSDTRPFAEKLTDLTPKELQAKLTWYTQAAMLVSEEIAKRGLLTE